MKQNSLETTDIFRGAFFLCMGGDLCRIRIKDNRRQIASFMIRGKDLHRLDREYRSGKALVNPLQLRDILFDTLRANKKGEKNDDRERENRGVKKEH